MIRHTKRVISPTFWNVGRKNHVWVVSVNPGPHGKRSSIPLLVLIRDVLKLTETAREAKAILSQGKVLVDEKIRKDFKFGVGFMDTISIPALKKTYRVVPYNKGLKIIEIDAKESKTKLLKVVSKQVNKKGKVQLTSHDGQNFLGVDANVGDTLVHKDGKISKILKFDVGSLFLVYKGRQAGRMGKLIKLDTLATLEGNKKKFEVPKDYIINIGEKTPVVKLYEETSD